MRALILMLTLAFGCAGPKSQERAEPAPTEPAPTQVEEPQAQPKTSSFGDPGEGWTRLTQSEDEFKVRRFDHDDGAKLSVARMAYPPESNPEQVMQSYDQLITGGQPAERRPRAFGSHDGSFMEVERDVSGEMHRIQVAYVPVPARSVVWIFMLSTPLTTAPDHADTLATFVTESQLPTP